MRLTELQPAFVVWEDSVEGSPDVAPMDGRFGDPYFHTVVRRVRTLKEAQGIIFKCPGCYHKSGKLEGVHSVYVSFHGRDVKPHQGSKGRDGMPTRWTVIPESTCMDDLSVLPSIDCGCWHGYLVDGDVTIIG